MKPLPILCFIFISLLVAFCKKKHTDSKASEYEMLSTYFMDRHSYELDTATKAVFIITDAGCFPCNKKFSNFASGYANDKSVLFIVTANATNLDLSSFPDSNTNIFYDSENKGYAWLKKSSALLINEAKVDSIVIIDARSIESQLEYIEQTTACKSKRSSLTTKTQP